MGDAVQPIPELGYRSLSATVQILDKPAGLLRRIMISREELLTTPSVDLAKIIRGRKAAPMVRVDGPSAFISNQGEIHATVVTPNIALKKAFEATDLLYSRREGTTLYMGESERNAAANRFIARELGELEDRILNREEWLCAQVLTGTISYSVDGQDHFTVTYPKSANQTVALTGADVWDNAASNPLNDIIDAKVVMDENTQLQPDIALCSPSAAEAIRNNEKLQVILDRQNVLGGAITFNSNVDMDGSMFIGVIGGVAFFQYGRAIDVPNGSGGFTNTALIRDKYVEFISTQASAECWMYYGGIADMRTIGAGRTVAMKRFSKSWEQDDPSARMVVVKSRPLPVARKPDFVYSLKVLA